MLPKRQAAAPSQPQVEPLKAVPAPSTDAVDRIFSYTESAVNSIVRRTEHQVRQMAAEVDARACGEAAERSVRLAELRRDLIERATALATHYEEILDQIDAVEVALAVFAGERGGRPAQSSGGENGTVTSLTEERRRRRWWRLWQRQAA